MSRVDVCIYVRVWFRMVRFRRNRSQHISGVSRVSPHISFSCYTNQPNKLCLRRKNVMSVLSLGKKKNEFFINDYSRLEPRAVSRFDPEIWFLN